jgi:hypothetical protein
MAVITAAIKSYCETEEGGEVTSGWKFSGRGNWHQLSYWENHSLRNSRLSTWRKVGLYRFG